ncbi:MAG: thioredoxin domain-containing protein [Hyphomonadaceae bacterium]
MNASRREFLCAGSGAALGFALFAGEASAQANPDITIGGAGSSVHLVEYASLTCPHCAAFHAEVFPRLKQNYIDTQRIRFTLREFPTQPVVVAVSGFLLARCGNPAPDVYYTRIGVLFERQRAILSTGNMEGVRRALVEIGIGWGLSEEQVMACITNEAAVPGIRAVVEEGVSRYGINSTPSLVLNEQVLRDSSAMTFDGLSSVLDAALSD